MSKEYLHIKEGNTEEVKLWDAVASSTAVQMGALMLRDSKQEEWGHCLDAAGSLGAQLADRVVVLRRKRLNLIEEPELPRLVVS